MATAHQFAGEPMMPTLGLILMVVGIALMLSGWLFFRLPGVPFWTFAPIWRANEYLYLPGVALWIAGGIVELSGLLIFTLTRVT
jgi:hypothetical protein